jgi:rare lipoprotein A
MRGNHFVAKGAAIAVAYCAFSATAFANTSDAGAQTGTASYYSDDRQDLRTANGEYYDRETLTAAHPTLPLGSWVKVTNLDNGRSVDVRINDRNDPDSGRMIDLSKAAAKAVGMIRAGLAQVRIERIAPHLHRITMHEPPHKPENQTVSQK